MLVCTTIVESGLDIPNANTLIVDRADTFGLLAAAPAARPGRAAAASGPTPTSSTRRRSRSPRPRTSGWRRSPSTPSSGAGMQVAMKDLEIRGAGNLLGAEQSGHIAGVGFDLYVRHGRRGRRPSSAGEAGAEERAEVRVELPVDAHMPHDYVPERAAAAGGVPPARRERGRRPADRRGPRGADRPVRPLPPPVETCSRSRGCRVARPQRRADRRRRCRATDIRFAPVELPDSRQVRLQRLYPGTLREARVRTMLVPRAEDGPVGGQPVVASSLLAWCGELVEAMFLADAG